MALIGDIISQLGAALLVLSVLLLACCMMLSARMRRGIGRLIGQAIRSGYLCLPLSAQGRISKAAQSREMIRKIIGWSMALVILGSSGFALLMGAWEAIVWMTPTLRYAEIFNTRTDQVEIEAQPTDCDFMRAPIGDKECHYKRMVMAYVTVTNPAYVQATNGVTEWDAQGHPISTDPPTITREYDPKIDKGADQVIVSWTKIEGD